MKLKRLASAAAMAVLACGSATFASDAQPAGFSAGPAQSLDPVLLDDAATAAPAASSTPSQTTLTPAMYLLSKCSFGQWLSSNNFSVTGWVEGGYFIDTNNTNLGTGPSGDSPTDITFAGTHSNRFLLDQLDLTLSKGFDTNKKFDWGFTFESGYGTDYTFFHSDGLLDNRYVNLGTRASLYPAEGHPQNQYDITQANVSFLFNTIGSGLTVKAGKFVALLGEEVNSPLYSYSSSTGPSGNPFYTHSYSFFYGVPDNNTGVLASYTFNNLIDSNNWTATGGFTNGWNQSLRDDNGAVDFLGQFSGKVTNYLAVVTNLEVGPETARDNSDYWTTLEVIPTVTVSDQLTVAVDCLYSDAPHQAGTTVGKSAQWYGAAAYAMYRIDSMFSLALRGEWFRDQGGLETGTQANYYELTFGTQIHPLPDDNIFQYLTIRPEIRGDASDRRVYNIGNRASGDYSELTAAVDIVMQF